MNIAEILKNCPKDMKLYSPIYGEIKFIQIMTSTGNIHCRTSKGDPHYFYPDGKYEREGECVLFPSKEQRDWNKFLIPFENGDVIITTDRIRDYPYENVAIFMKYQENDETSNKMVIYCQTDALGVFIPEKMNVTHENWRKATEEEKETFYARIREEGYYLCNNTPVKNIFRFGDIVAMYNEQYQHTHIAIFDKYIGDKFMKVVCTNLADSNEIKIFGESDYWYKQDVRYATEKEKEFFFDLLREQNYVWTGEKLIEKKFDIHSLKPYDKVLVKSGDGCWYPTLVSYVDSSREIYLIDTVESKMQVIPFEGNEHLIGTYSDPDPYYITWK